MFDFIDKNMLKIKLNSWLYCLFLASILSAIATFVIKYPAVTQELDATTSPTKLTEKPESEPLIEQLIGRWEVELSNGISSVFIFAPDGEFFDLSTPDIAVRFYWVIDRTQPQPQVFVNFGIGILKVNLLDSEEMQMRILPLVPIPNVNSEAIEKLVLPVRKLSSDYSLPVGTNVIEAQDFYQQQANLAKQSEAKIYISSINRLQQANFAEHEKFIPDIQTITQELGIKSQTSDYNYQVFLSQDDTVANVVAIPRDENLRAYVGRVTTKSNGSRLTLVAIECESIKPTNNPPLLPLPTVIGGNLECPTDYESLSLNQQRDGSSRQSEAKIYISSINRLQQANFAEHEKFIPDIQTITQELGIKSQTSDYNYQVFLSQDDTVANVVAIPRDENLRAYVGRVTTESNTTGVTTVAIECESIKLTNNFPSLPNVVGANLQCPNDYKPLNLQGSSPVSLPVEPVPQPSFSPLPSLPRLPKAPRLPTLPPQPSFSPLPTLPRLPKAPRLPTPPLPPSPVPSPSSSSDLR